MPRNSSGSYIPPVSTWNPAVPGVTIQSDDWNSLLQDMALALTQSFATDDQTTAEARIPFAQGVSVGNGTLALPSVNFISDPDTGIYRLTTNTIGISAGGVSVLEANPFLLSFPVPVFFANGTFSGNVILGNEVTDTLTINATTTVTAPFTFEEDGTFEGDVAFTGTLAVPDASFSNAKLANMANGRIKARVTSGTGVPEDATGTQVTALLDAVVGATQSVAGTKGLTPAPAAGDQWKPLAGDGTYKRGLGRAFGCIITTTSVNGSQPTLTGTYNVASISTLTVVGSLASATLTFTNALPDTNYAIHAQCPDYTVPTGYSTRTTTTVVIQWNGNPGEVSVSGF